MYKGSTDQKTGESMEKPGKKLKKFFIITGITGMVYAGLKYLLPLVVPLLLGYTLALLLRPFFTAPDYSANIWKKMEAITGTDRIGTVTDLSGAWKFSAIQEAGASAVCGKKRLL